MYGAYGDGYGFAPHVPQKLSMGFVRITGGPIDFVGRTNRLRRIEHPLEHG
jgi:hypothetical protein